MIKEQIDSVKSGFKNQKLNLKNKLSLPILTTYCIITFQLGYYLFHVVSKERSTRNYKWNKNLFSKSELP